MLYVMHTMNMSAKKFTKKVTKTRKVSELNNKVSN